jgi:hypothetical protein
MEQKVENEIKEYDLLGFRLKVTDEMIAESDSEIRPSEVIELVQEKIREINSNAAHLSDTEKMVMVALELAEINLKNQAVFQNDIDRLQSCAKDALSYISEIEPI